MNGNETMTLDEQIETFEAREREGTEALTAATAAASQAAIEGGAVDESAVLSASIRLDITRGALAMLRRKRDEQNKAAADGVRAEQERELAECVAELHNPEGLTPIRERYAALVGQIEALDADFTAECSRLWGVRARAHELRRELGLPGEVALPNFDATSVRRLLVGRYEKDNRPGIDCARGWFALLG